MRAEPNNPNQLFLGTYRLYRTDNAKAPSAGDVKWKAISADLTTGCTGTAPNGARNCTISAIGVGGGEAVYTGSLDGLVYVSPDAQVNDDPTWTRVGKDHDLPARPVTAFAVDRSNYRDGLRAFNGFNGATPGQPGHVFRTLDGGKNWTDVSGNLPDTPVNSLVLDPAYPNTLYAGTDVGAVRDHNGGTRLGGRSARASRSSPSGRSTSTRLTAARRRYPRTRRVRPDRPRLPLRRSSSRRSTPASPSGRRATSTYSLTLKNIGNAPATGVTITDPVPDNTSFVSADSGGAESGGTVTWNGLSVPAGGSVTVHFTVSIASALKKKVDSIVNDGFQATAAGGFSTTGSPFITPIAPPYAMTFGPATQRDGGRVGTSVPYTVTVRNLGFNSDSYALTASNAWTTTFFDSTCTTPLTTVGPLRPATRRTCVSRSRCLAVPPTRRSTPGP